MKKLILAFNFIFLGFTSSCAYNEFSYNSKRNTYLGSVDTKITSILNYSVNTKGEYLIYGLTQDNQLVRQLISNIKNSKVENKDVSTIYHFDKSIQPNHIAFDGSKVAYIKNDTVYSIDTNTNVFKVKKHQDKVLKKSDLLLLKIIDNTIQVFCKQGKNNYFIYKLSDKKYKQIKFNFTPGTVINNFKIKDDKYLISGHINDPFLNDQYAYFTETNLKGKMIWEKQEGKSNVVSVGFDIDTKNKLLYSIDKAIFMEDALKIVRNENGKILSNITDARVINGNNKKSLFFLGNKKMYFFENIESTDDYLFTNFIKIEIINDSIIKNQVSLVQDSVLPYMFTTEKKYKKGDGFQLKALKKDDFNVRVISFSGDGKIDKFFPKINEDENNRIYIPSKESKFEKIDDNDEYLLLLYSKDKTDFITEKQWNSDVIKNLSLFLLIKSFDLDYAFKARGWGRFERCPGIECKQIYTDFYKPVSMIPVLLKIKGTNNSKTEENG